MVGMLYGSYQVCISLGFWLAAGHRARRAARAPRACQGQELGLAGWARSLPQSATWSQHEAQAAHAAVADAGHGHVAGKQLAHADRGGGGSAADAVLLPLCAQPGQPAALLPAGRADKAGTKGATQCGQCTLLPEWIERCPPAPARHLSGRTG